MRGCSQFAQVKRVTGTSSRVTQCLVPVRFAVLREPTDVDMAGEVDHAPFGDHAAVPGKWEKTLCGRTIGRLEEAGMPLVAEDNETGTALPAAFKRDPGAVTSAFSRQCAGRR